MGLGQKNTGKALTAVVFSYSRVNADPRLLRQLYWLDELGFDVTVVGYGLEGLNSSAEHNVPIQSFASRLFNYLRPSKSRFKGLFGRYLPEALVHEVERADMILVNELEFIPFLNTTRFRGPVYLDLHENHVDGLSGSWLERIFFARYWKWQLKQSELFVSKCRSRLFVTTVESEIAEKYKKFYNLKSVELILNAPRVIELEPRGVSSPLALVHHGMSKSNRGIETIVRSMAQLRGHAELTLMLVKEPTIPFVATKVRFLKWVLRLGDLVTSSDPVAVFDVSRALSKHDIALVLGSDKTGNDLYALPNKFFQSVQAGLMIICGPNPAVAKIVREHQLGIVLPNWEADSLTSAVQGLSVQDVEAFKAKTRDARFHLSESHSREVFIRGVSRLLSNNKGNRGVS